MLLRIFQPIDADFLRRAVGDAALVVGFVNVKRHLAGVAGADLGGEAKLAFDVEGDAMLAPAHIDEPHYGDRHALDTFVYSHLDAVRHTVFPKLRDGGGHDAGDGLALLGALGVTRQGRQLIKLGQGDGLTVLDVGGGVEEAVDDAGLCCRATVGGAAY